MSLLHSLLAGYLRAAGRHRDAADIEEAAAPAVRRRELAASDYMPSTSLPAAMPALVVYGDERDVAQGVASVRAVASVAGAAASSVTNRSDARASAPLPSAGPQATVSEACDEGTRTTATGEREQAATAAAEAALAEPPVDLAADPLAGIRSHGLRERLERDAFRSASDTAQDSEIARAAQRLLPSELRGLLRHDSASFDTSPAARAARIEALGGDIPPWAKGDPANDPTLLRSAERSRLPTQAPSQMPSQPPAAHSTRTVRARSDDREM